MISDRGLFRFAMNGRLGRKVKKLILLDDSLLRPLLAADFFEKPGHVLAQSLHRLNAFRIVFHFSGVSTDSHVPVTGTRDHHLVDQEKIIHRTEDMSGARTTDSNDSCTHLSLEQVSVGAGYDRAPFNEGLHIGRHVRDLSKRENPSG